MLAVCACWRYVCVCACVRGWVCVYVCVRICRRLGVGVWPTRWQKRRLPDSANGNEWYIEQHMICLGRSTNDESGQTTNLDEHNEHDLGYIYGGHISTKSALSYGRETGSLVCGVVSSAPPRSALPSAHGGATVMHIVLYVRPHQPFLHYVAISDRRPAGPFKHVFEQGPAYSALVVDNCRMFGHSSGAILGIRNTVGVAGVGCVVGIIHCSTIYTRLYIFERLLPYGRYVLYFRYVRDG